MVWSPSAAVDPEGPIVLEALIRGFLFDQGA
jgi:hypothetical protein